MTATATRETEGQEAQRIQSQTDQLHEIKEKGKEAHNSMFWRAKAIRAEADAAWVPICLDALHDVKQFLLQANQLMKSIEPFPELVEPARELMKDAGRRAHEAILLLEKRRDTARAQARVPRQEEQRSNA